MTDNQRISIIKFIISHTLFLGKLRKESDGIIEFLEMIWELRTMPSDDKIIGFLQHTKTHGSTWLIMMIGVMNTHF